jgi:hypothetical protein
VRPAHRFLMNKRATHDQRDLPTVTPISHIAKEGAYFLTPTTMDHLESGVDGLTTMMGNMTHSSDGSPVADV